MNQNKTEVFQELIKREPNFLDRPLAELLPMRFMGEVAVNAYRALIKRLDNLPLAQEEKTAKLKDGQDAGKALLMIEARIGQLLPRPEETRPALPGKKTGRFEAGKKRLPEGIDSHQAHRARAIASHPQEVEEVIREAEENEDIPTKTAVLNKIAYKRELARKRGEREKTQIEMKGDAYLYYSRIEEAFRLIPSKPPVDLVEKDYLMIKAIALSIIKKLEVFFDEKKVKDLPKSG